MNNEAYELEGFDGEWHAVISRPIDYDAMRAKLGSAQGPLTDQHAVALLDAGDSQFSAVNPRTMETEVYAVVTEDNGQTFQLFRRVESTS